MHANYHRKHEAIVKNGFQRFRATEECNTDHCVFKGQKTTHFHCRRENCKYTFKNKADMEKHKTYHLKDEMLLRDGYKKFLKSEDCTYKNCRFSRVCNHIHCMHENCHYVLHSSGQLLSHKRKHERMDTEVDYRKFQMARNLLGKFGGGGSAKEEDDVPEVADPQRNPVLDLLAIMSELTFRALPLQMMLHMRMQMLQSMNYDQVLAPENIDGLRKLSEGVVGDEYLKQLYKFNEDVCHLNERPAMDGSTALTDLVGGQSSPLSSLPRSFGNPADQLPMKRKLLEDPVVATPQESLFFNNSALNKSKLLSNPSVDYRLLKKDDSGCGESSTETSASPTDRQKNLLESANFLQFTSSKTLFNRKRGRPRKNHVMEVYNNVQDSPQAIFTSFKLEKNDSSSSSNRPVAVVDHQPPLKDPQLTATEFRKDLLGIKSEDEDGGSSKRSPSSKMFFPPGNLESTTVTPMSLFGTPDFGGFSQILEKHMREIKSEPNATVTHELDLSAKEKARNHLKCVVCNQLFETFADIKEHECHAREPEKPLLTFPPSLALHQAAFRGSFPPEYQPPGQQIPTVPPGVLPLSKDSISLVKTTGTFFPDVNANKLKFF